MAASAGSELVNDGLVFAYDMNNAKKSWKGRPIVNIIGPANNATNTYMPSNRPFSGLPHSQSGNFGNNITTEVSPPVSSQTVYKIIDDGLDTQNVRYSIRIDMDNSWIDYDRTYVWSCYVWLPSQYVGRWSSTFSAEVYQNSTGTDWHSTVGFDTTYNYYGAGTIKTAGPNGINSGIDINKLDQWQRIWVVFTPTTANIQLVENVGNDNNKWVAGYMRVNINNAVNGGTPYHLYLSAGQIEEGTFVTDFVLNERMPTQSIKDLTNSSTITINSVTYNPDNTFSFTGGTERIDLTSIGGSGVFNNHFTISAWINSTNISLTQNILSMNGPYFMRIVGSKVRFNVLAGSPSASWLFQNGTTTLSSNTWYFLTMVWDGTANTWTGYINDQQEFSVSKTGPLNGHTSAKTFFGYVGYTPQAGEQSNFFGQIPVVYYYNRALNSTEVSQNFNALRSRYGI